MVAIPELEAKLLTEVEYKAVGDAYEIIDGLPVEKEPMSPPAVMTRDNVFRILDAVNNNTSTGLLMGDGFSYLMWKTRKGIKGAFIPDVSYIRNENISSEWDYAGSYPGVPDLAIEVVSENDNAEKLMAKVRGYLDRGTEQVWVIYLEIQELHQYLHHESICITSRSCRISIVRAINSMHPLFPRRRNRHCRYFQEAAPKITCQTGVRRLAEKVGVGLVVSSPEDDYNNHEDDGCRRTRWHWPPDILP